MDPGPALRRLEADILAQAPHLAPALDRAVTPGLGERRSTRPAEQRPFVGRDAELERLRRAAEAASRRRQPTLALLSGDPGAGKTALAEALTRRLAAEGWTRPRGDAARSTRALRPAGRGPRSPTRSPGRAAAVRAAASLVAVDPEDGSADGSA